MQQTLATYSHPITTHIGEPDALWTDTSRTTQPTTLVVTPVQLHKRNIETRLRKQAQPMSSLTFRRLRGVATDLLTTAEQPATAADRVDRLTYLSEILTDTHHPVYTHLGAVLGEPLSDHRERVERARSELELVTGFHPERMQRFADAVQAAAVEPTAPTVVDTLDLLAGVSRLQCDLTDRLTTESKERATESKPRLGSETAVLARAIRELVADHDIWTAAYPSIERLAVAGVSMLTAPLEDLLRVVATQTDTDVHLYLRTASGPAIDEHLARTTAVDVPGTQGVFAWR